MDTRMAYADPLSGTTGLCRASRPPRWWTLCAARRDTPHPARQRRRSAELPDPGPDVLGRSRQAWFRVRCRRGNEDATADHARQRKLLYGWFACSDVLCDAAAQLLGCA